MKFNCKKTGFTLAEVLIVLLIVTVLTIFSINAIRPRATTTPLLYQRAYEALDTAAYNAWLQAGDEGKVFAGDTADQIAPFKNVAKNLSVLCRQLAGNDGYINTMTPESHCDRDALAIPTLGNENFTQDNAHFIATNGMRFYMSAERQGINSNYINSRNEAVNPRWYVVFVDLDGEKGLGTMAQPADSNNTADVVAFAIVIPSTVGERPVVIPIGVPTMDRRYMTAVVKYPDNGSGKDIMSLNLTYKEAAIKAYGSQQGSGSSVQIRRPERIYLESYLGGSNNKLLYAPLPPTITLDASKGCNDKGIVGACSVIINSYTGASNR